MISVVGSSTVAIGSLKPYRGNARRGDVPSIAESLSHHGQYRSVVANRRTKTILAGHHVVKAAKSLGLTHVEVDWVDVDDATERVILLADNRTGDLADTDHHALQALLESLPDLDGTLFTEADLAHLDEIYGGGATPRGGGGETDMTRVLLGPHRYSADEDVMVAWSARHVEMAGSKAAAGREIPEALGIPREPRKPKPRKVAQTATGRLTPPELVALGDLTPFPGNAREGDVGAVAESLARLGAYRSIVANRRTGHILVGNHTHAAAQALGWEALPVRWVDVDEVEETKIVVADNRASDLATYDDDALRALLLDLASGDITGSGFDGDDIDSILAGGSSKPGPSRSRRVTLTVADLTARVERGLMDRWLATLPEDPRSVIEDRLGLPPGVLEPT